MTKPGNWGTLAVIATGRFLIGCLDGVLLILCLLFMVAGGIAFLLDLTPELPVAEYRP